MSRKIEPFYVYLGERIARVRTEKGLTQGQLGKALDPPVTRATVSNIESAKQRCMAHTLTQLARALGVEVGELTSRRRWLLRNARRHARIKKVA